MDPGDDLDFPGGGVLTASGLIIGVILLLCLLTLLAFAGPAGTSTWAWILLGVLPAALIFLAMRTRAADRVSVSFRDRHVVFPGDAVSFARVAGILLRTELIGPGEIATVFTTTATLTRSQATTLALLVVPRAVAEEPAWARVLRRLGTQGARGPLRFRSEDERDRCVFSWVQHARRFWRTGRVVRAYRTARELAERLGVPLIELNDVDAPELLNSGPEAVPAPPREATA